MWVSSATRSVNVEHVVVVDEWCVERGGGGGGSFLYSVESLLLRKKMRVGWKLTHQQQTTHHGNHRDLQTCKKRKKRVPC